MTVKQAAFQIRAYNAWRYIWDTRVISDEKIIILQILIFGNRQKDRNISKKKNSSVILIELCTFILMGSHKFKSFAIFLGFTETCKR